MLQPSAQLTEEMAQSMDSGGETWRPRTGRVASGRVRVARRRRVGQKKHRTPSSASGFVSRPVPLSIHCSWQVVGCFLFVWCACFSRGLAKKRRFVLATMPRVAKKHVLGRNCGSQSFSHSQMCFVPFCPARLVDVLSAGCVLGVEKGVASAVCL